MTQLDPKSRPDFRTRPLFLQVYDHFVELIAAGEFEAGRFLESETDLAQRMKVSVGTIRKALDALEAEKLVTRRQGRGTVVADLSSDEFNIRFSNLRGRDGKRVTGTIAHKTVEVVAANAEELARLELRAGDLVYRCERVRELYGRKFMVEQLSVPKSRLPDIELDEFGIARVVAIAAKRNKMILGNGFERVSVSRASPAVAQALEIDPDTPMLHLDRTVYELNGPPLEWRVADCDLKEQYYKAEFPTMGQV